jgi:maltose alpha-D-glucosyltransferase/alpha-amylase
MHRTRGWLRDAVVYEIYPQSFADSNGDGIGDLPGALARLDYLKWLGINTIWFNPCFASPFVDAGYDVSDYLSVAPRYGTNEDLVGFISAAWERGIRVVLDLVVGHTSDRHAWFQTERQMTDGSPDAERYIWAVDDPTSGVDVGVLGTSPWVLSPGPRRGWYLKNFFDAQPALNFGYARLRDDEPWRQAVGSPGPRLNREALRDIMSFWLERGASGFRVDMAFSLVKDDEGLVETTRLWREMRRWLDTSFPGAVLIPEGVEPLLGSEPAFDADFFLVIGEEHSSLFNNGGAGRLPHLAPAPCFFDAEGAGSLATFLGSWRRVRDERPGRLVLMGSADHDFSRLACGTREADQLGAAFTFLLTWGSVPVIYYGDEIGLPFQPDAPEVEGSVCHPGYYDRAGARTPMQWDSGPNAGFSTALPEVMYLPVDPSPDRVTVETQVDDPDSVLNLVRRLIWLRGQYPDLRTGTDSVVLNAGYPFAYLRGERLLVVVNPRREAASCSLGEVEQASLVLGSGVHVSGGQAEASGFGYGIFAVPV